MSAALLDITGQWAKLNESMVALIDHIPDDKLDYSPREDLWNFRGTLAHVAIARNNWLGGVVKDGEETPNVLAEIGTKAGLQEQLRLSWERVGRFLSDPAKVAASYEDSWGGETKQISGHWVAFHLLEHDIHHRADVFHYLALLGIEHPDVGTP